MSSNQNNNARGRVSSIRHRLAGQRVRLKIGMHFGQYIMLILIMSFVWLAAREYMADTGSSFFGRTRSITLSPVIEDADNFRELRSALNTLRYTVV